MALVEHACGLNTIECVQALESRQGHEKAAAAAALNEHRRTIAAQLRASGEAAEAWQAELDAFAAHCALHSSRH